MPHFCKRGIVYICEITDTEHEPGGNITYYPRFMTTFYTSQLPYESQISFPYCISVQCVTQVHAPEWKSQPVTRDMPRRKQHLHAEEVSKITGKKQRPEENEGRERVIGH